MHKNKKRGKKPFYFRVLQYLKDSKLKVPVLIDNNVCECPPWEFFTIKSINYT